MHKYLIFFLITLFSITSYADEAKLTFKKVKDNIYVIQGNGGNIGVVIDEKGVFLIDDQFAPVTEEVKKNITSVSDKPIKFVLNTHFHKDHTGGNENFGKSGSIIVSHENVRKRLTKKQFIEEFNMEMLPYSKEALPVITFSQDLDFHMGKDQLAIRHLANAHTDGDSYVKVQNANVIHTGDIYFNGLYPFIDVNHGGSVKGIIKAAKEIAKNANEHTIIIPGHGEVSNLKQFKGYIKMLEIISTNVEKAIKEGKTLEEIIASKPTKEFDEKINTVFIAPDAFVTTLYKSLKK